MHTYQSSDIFYRTERACQNVEISHLEQGGFIIVSGGDHEARWVARAGKAHWNRDCWSSGLGSKVGVPDCSDNNTALTDAQYLNPELSICDFTTTSIHRQKQTDPVASTAQIRSPTLANNGTEALEGELKEAKGVMGAH